MMSHFFYSGGMRKTPAASAALGLLLASISANAYYGKSSGQATLTFDTVADVNLEQAMPTKAELNQPGKVRDAAIARVQKQFIHLVGVFHSASFQSSNQAGHPASVGPWYQMDTFKVVFGQPEKSPIASGRVRLPYHFEGTVVFAKDFFNGHVEHEVDLWLPLAWDQMYKIKNIKKCTDAEDPRPTSFYYYWDPYQKGCPLQKEAKDQVNWFKGHLVRIPNTGFNPSVPDSHDTFPEYDRLFKNGSLDIAVFEGYINHHVSTKEMSRKDDGYKGFRDLTKHLEEDGFTLQLDQANFKINKDGEISQQKGANELRKYTKEVTALGKPLKLNVNVLMTDTALESRDPTFHHYLIPALRNAEIFAYDGHSGDGDNLSPTELGFKGFKPTKYQLFFLNGCDSYLNYLQQFLGARGNTENMDLILSSTPTLSSVGSDNTWALIKSLSDGQTPSYQQILRAIEKSNGEDPTSLTGVYGDEDNEWAPPKR